MQDSLFCTCKVEIFFFFFYPMANFFFLEGETFMFHMSQTRQRLLF